MKEKNFLFILTLTIINILIFVLGVTFIYTFLEALLSEFVSHNSFAGYSIYTIDSGVTLNEENITITVNNNKTADYYGVFSVSVEDSKDYKFYLFQILYQPLTEEVDGYPILVNGSSLFSSKVNYGRYNYHNEDYTYNYNFEDEIINQTYYIDDCNCLEYEYEIPLNSGENTIVINYLIHGDTDEYYKNEVYNYIIMPTPSRYFTYKGNTVINVVTEDTHLFSSYDFEKSENTYCYESEESCSEITFKIAEYYPISFADLVAILFYSCVGLIVIDIVLAIIYHKNTRHLRRFYRKKYEQQRQKIINSLRDK